jgi:hypothetical protein
MSDTEISPVQSIPPVILRPWPKIVMMIPTLLMAIFCGIVMALYPPTSLPETYHQTFHWLHFVNLLFLLVLALNLILLLYDLSLRGFLIIALSILVVVLALFLLNQRTGNVWRTLSQALSIRVMANAAFYFIFSLVLLINLVIAWIITRFHYWVVDHNEIIIHKGFMHEQERHPTSTARFTLEIDDVIEYALFGSGNLIFTFTDEQRPRELMTVLRIRHKAHQLDQLLGRLAVTEK